MRGKSLKRIKAWGALLYIATAGIATAQAQRAAMAPPIGGATRLRLPVQSPLFAGKIAPDARDAQPAYPPPVTPPVGAPNILLIMTDDEAFGATSAFGGPIPTPNLAALADKGLSYTRFHTTAMCSPTRAALLTGRNHHAAGSGSLTNYASGYPGYTSIIPDSTATIAKILRLNGYNTAMFGKHHNVPLWQTTAAGPFDAWPTGLGFDYFYGFLGSDTDQFHPSLYRGTNRVSEPPDGKLLGERLSDDAIAWVHNQKAADPAKPFFVYLAPGAGHAPAQAPSDYLARFQGRFDQGWDVLRAETVERQKTRGIVPHSAALTTRPDGVPPWSSLDAGQRRIAARFMEAYAASVAYEDAQIGRLIDELKRMGLWDNLLVLYLVGDNGADAAGGARGQWNELGGYGTGASDSDTDRIAALDLIGTEHSYSIHPAGWSWAMDAPFPYFKQIASHLGGSRNGLVLSWPRRFGRDGGVRTQFSHVTDIAPTIYEAVGIPAPDSVDGTKQKPLAGASLLYSVDNAKAPSRHQTQYFELLGNRAIYHDGWWANTTPQVRPWAFDPGEKVARASTFGWELYDLERDFAQAHDLAARRPDKLAEMQALWAREAQANDVLPLDPRMGAERAMAVGLPTGQPARMHYVLWGKGTRLDWDNAPMLGYMGFMIEADIIVPADGPRGVILASGSHIGGWSFHIEDGRPVAMEVLGAARRRIYRVVADRPLAPGKHRLGYHFVRDGTGGLLTILIDGVSVGEGRINQLLFRGGGQGESMDVGFDSGGQVAPEAYVGDGAFNGEIAKVEIRLTPPLAP